jgi:hypothetical protein
MHNSTMNFDIKALLTLLLLKQGTSSKDIQTAVNLTAAARLMVAEEYLDLMQQDGAPEGRNVTKLRSGRQPEAARPFDPQADAMNSDIKALLMLLLLQNGASSREIQTTLRLASKLRGATADEQTEAPLRDVAVAALSKALEMRAEPLPEPLPETRTETRTASPKQTLRAEHLAPIALREFAA